MKRTLEADIEPQYNLIDLLWTAGYRVPSPILIALTALGPYQVDQPLSIDVPILLGSRKTTVRFIQGRIDDDFSTVHCDLFLALDKKTEASSLTAAWTNTTKIDTDIFSLEKRWRCRYGHYRSMLNLLSSILWKAFNQGGGELFIVVLACKAGKERSLLVFLVLLMMLHGLHLLELEKDSALVDRVKYMNNQLFEIQSLGGYPLTAHGTEKFKTLFNLLGMQLASLRIK